MPELPEVETIRQNLDSTIIGKTIATIQIFESKQFIGNQALAIGKTINGISRKGKILTLILNSNYYISFHLKLTGQILFAPDKTNAVFKNTIPQSNTNTLPGSTTRIVIEFTDNSALYFNDLRKFGWVKITLGLEETTSVDILSKNFTFDYFYNVIHSAKKPIKPYLMEQDKITGLGNIYANDSAWEAKINPLRKTNTLTDKEIHNLYLAIKIIIGEGIKFKGSSAQDEMYVLPNSEKGSYQYHFKVYHRENKPCLRCQTPIVRVKQGGRSTFYCPRCQI